MRNSGTGVGSRRLIPVLAVIAVLASSCYYAAALKVQSASGGTQVADWCQGPPDLSAQDCNAVSLAFDLALGYAAPYRSLSDFTTAGATEVTVRPTGIGVPYALPGCCAAFDPHAPSLLLYDGTAPSSRLVGVGWGVDGAEPDGFAGDHDQWTQVGGRWFLTAWIVRGYLNDPDVFAASHPCLVSGAVYTDTTSACFLASHTDDLEVLVTNDDGIGAPGIDALVEALRVVPGVHVTVVAPATNQSGTGDSTTAGGVSAAAGSTASGYAGTAVDGTPGDSVIYGIGTMGLAPDLVVSGINEGQNIGPFTAISGTVGAAKWGARSFVPSIATSQGVPGSDFPSGVTATLDLVEQFRLGEILHDVSIVTNINIPSCATGTVREPIETVVGAGLDGRNYFEQNCESTEPVGSVTDDVDAFNFGFIGITQIPS